MTAIAITGPTGVGKTFNTVVFAHKQYNGDIFIVRHLEDLKDYKKQKCIIFDDISFETVEPTQLLKLCDRDLHCSICILNKIVKIEPDVVKLFTHNHIEAFRPILASVEQQKAIDRRLTVCQVTKRRQVSQRLLETLQNNASTEHSIALSQYLELE